MPNGWVHAIIDLIAYGRPYFDLHKEKDKAHETLGLKHRIVNHKWYQDYGKAWDFRDPFPSSIKDLILRIRNEEGDEKAEEQMAWIDHDYIDRIWDDLSSHERRYWEGFFIWVLLSHKILREWAGVDVQEGKIHRLIDGREIWENCPEVKREYQRLCRYVKSVRRNNKDLQNVCRCYGGRD
jgi:hypothetical protein